MHGSLRQKALFVIVGICLLALISVGSSLWFALVTESDAAAINIAGSLRMQSWRLAEQVLIPELTSQEVLVRLVAIYDNSINSDPLVKLQGHQGSLGDAYRLVSEQWYVQMRPLLVSPSGYETFIYQVPGFVDHIDQMVTALQNHTEQKLQQLFITALFILISILGMGWLSIRFVNQHLLRPIDDLGAAAGKIKRGDFTGLQLSYNAQNEMGELTQTFRGMALELGRLYQDLEDKVIRKTEALAQSNHALELLYKASQNLASNPYDEELVTSLIEEWQDLLGLDSCYVCLSDVADSTRLQKIGTDREEPSCTGGHCVDCIKNSSQTLSAESGSWQFALLAKEHNFGFLKVSVNSEARFTGESRQWLQTFSDLVATSLYQSRARTQDRRMLLMEERAVIARELHDSLAQALSYQKIQMLRLRRQLVKSSSPPNVLSILDELKDGTNNAYAQLRELLRTFRLTLAEGDLEQALQKTLDEYSHRSPGIQFNLDYQLRYCSIDAHDQIHALQIVREALMNVVKHAHAHQATVICYQTEAGSLAISITDDGCGIHSNPPVSGHYGTTIMRERASSMGGTLDIRASSSGGVEVYLEFRRSEESQNE